MSIGNSRRSKTNLDVKKLVLTAVMTALVAVFQLLAEFTKVFGVFSTAMALIPIIIGAALCGIGAGAWLGFVFGFVVIFLPTTTLFLQFSIVGTVVTVLLKGIACGFVGAFAYKLLAKHSKIAAVITASALTPVVNTGIFLLGGIIFFLKDADLIAEAVGLEAGGMAVFWALATANFIVELLTCVLVSPITVRLLDIKRKI